MIKHIKKAIKAVIAAVQEEEEISDKKIVVIDSTNGEPDLRVVGLFTDVVEEKIAEIVHGLLYMNALNKLEPEKEKRKDIEFYISTYGGSADDMFALYDIMKQVQKETDIVTIGMGKVMSAGVLLLAGGTPGKRKIGRNCRVMLHSVVAGNHGALHNLINEMEAIQDLQKMYINRLVEDTKMTKSQLKKMLERKVNIYLSAEEAIKYGIADIIV
jgi:ATP-dependent Clp endopeptidase proteolytic subunit ClpP